MEEEDSAKVGRRPSTKKVSLQGTIFNCLKLIFGFGTFILPYSTFVSGWLCAFICFIIGASLMIWSAFVIADSEDIYRKASKDRDSNFTFTTLTGAILGNKGKIPLQATLFITLFLMISFYLVGIAEMLSKNPQLHFKGCTNVYIILVALPAFFLSFIQSMRLISFASMFGMSAVILSIVLSIVSGIKGPTLTSEIPNQAVKDQFIKKGVLSLFNFSFRSINTLLIDTVFLFSLALCCVEFRQPMKKPKKEFKKAVVISITIAALLNLGYCLACALLFRDSLNFTNKAKEYFKNDKALEKALGEFIGGKNIINHISLENKWFKMIASITLSLNLLFSIMLVSRVPVAIVEDVFKKQLNEFKGGMKNKILIGIKFVFMATCAVVAILFKHSLGVFVNLIGAVCFPILCFIFPMMFILKQGEGGMKDKIKAGIFGILGGYFIVVGLALSIF